MEHTSASDLLLRAFTDKNDVKFNSYHLKFSCYVTERGQMFPVKRRGKFRDVHSSNAANVPKVQRIADLWLGPFLFVLLSRLFSSFKLFSQSYLTLNSRKTKTIFLFVISTQKGVSDASTLKSNLDLMPKVFTSQYLSNEHVKC